MWVNVGFPSVCCLVCLQVGCIMETWRRNLNCCTSSTSHQVTDCCLNAGILHQFSASSVPEAMRVEISFQCWYVAGGCIRGTALASHTIVNGQAGGTEQGCAGLTVRQSNVKGPDKSNIVTKTVLGSLYEEKIPRIYAEKCLSSRLSSRLSSHLFATFRPEKRNLSAAKNLNSLSVFFLFFF